MAPISKDQLARFVRYLNQNQLTHNKIRYFSTKKKKTILKELRDLYEIDMTGEQVEFTPKQAGLISAIFEPCGKLWFLDNQWTSLPRSKPNLPPIQFKRGPITLYFNGGASRPVGREEASSPDQSRLRSVIPLLIFSNDFLTSGHRFF